MNSSVGITSKDSSNVFANNVFFKGLDVCLTAFNKKNFFQGGNIKIDSFNGVCKIPYLIEKGSSLFIGNEKIKYNSEDVESMMYGKQFGKATEK